MSSSPIAGRQRRSFYGSPVLAVFASAMSCLCALLLTSILPSNPVVVVLIWVLCLFIGWRWAVGTHRAYKKASQVSDRDEISVKYSSLEGIEESRLIEFLFFSSENSRKKPSEQVLLMTKRDRLYFIGRLAAMVSMGFLLIAVTLIGTAVVNSVPTAATDGEVNWVMIVVLVLVAVLIMAFGDAELDDRTLIIAGTIFLVGFWMFRAPVSMTVLMPAMIGVFGLLSSVWLWLDWKSWFFVATSGKVYLIRLYPLGWQWLNDRKRSLRLRGIQEVELENPWWAKQFNSDIGNLLLNGPTDESKQFKHITWLPNAELIHFVLESAIENREGSSPT